MDSEHIMLAMEEEEKKEEEVVDDLDGFMDANPHLMADDFDDSTDDDMDLMNVPVVYTQKGLSNWADDHGDINDLDEKLEEEMKGYDAPENEHLHQHNAATKGGGSHYTKGGDHFNAYEDAGLVEAPSKEELKTIDFK